MAQIYPAAPQFYRNIGQGSTGADTAQVQTWLNGVRRTWPAIESLETDGKFGAATRRAVQSFQTTNGLAADGVVGKNTWDALYSRYADLYGPGRVYPGVPVREGDRGAAVRDIQQKLKTTVPSLEADGIFGRKTRGAVSAYQTLNGLTADGIVGSNTYKKLFD